jgi:periplasmic protein CpxP/Spy
VEVDRHWPDASSIKHTASTNSSIKKLSVFSSTYPKLSMKNKLARLLPIFAVILTVPTFSITAHANSADLSTARPAKNTARIAQGQPGTINLTAEQKTKIDRLQQSTRSKIEAVLNPEQLKKFQQIKQQQAQFSSGGGISNVTADQKAKVQTIDRSTEEKILAVLTPEQQSQLKQGGQKKGGPDKIALTSEQKAKIEQLGAARRNQIEAILTPPQKSQLKADEERMQSLEQASKGLESTLTPDQQAKITAIKQASNEQLKTILTGQQSKPKASKQTIGQSFA